LIIYNVHSCAFRFQSLSIRSQVGPFTVALTGDASPRISIQATTITCTKDTTFPVQVVNAGSGQLPDLSVTSSSSWLTVSIDNSPANTAIISNSVSTAGLAAGVYHARVNVSGSNLAAGFYNVVLQTGAAAGDSIILVEPSAGASYTATQNMHIRWSADIRTVDNLTIQASTDDGLSWLTIHDNVISILDSSWGDFVWSIPLSLPGLPSGKCRIRIMNYIGTSATTSAAFSIVLPDSASIDWTPAKARITPGRVRCDVGGSVQFSVRAYNKEGFVVPADFIWQVSGGGTISAAGLFASNGTLGRFNVSAYCPQYPAVSTSAVVDISDNTLSIGSPKGGEVYQVGQRTSIEWWGDSETFGVAVVQLSVDNGVTWHVLSQQGIGGSDPAWGAFPWEIPDRIGGISTISNECLIKIHAYEDISNCIVSEQFSIIAPIAAAIGTEGGALSLGEVAKVEIPPGARTTSTEIGIVQTRSLVAPPAGYQLNNDGDVFLFTPHGTTFAEPIMISLPYSGPKENVKILRRSTEESESWEVIENLLFDDVNAPGKVFFLAKTFSVYAAAAAYGATSAAKSAPLIAPQYTKPSVVIHTGSGYMVIHAHTAAPASISVHTLAGRLAGKWAIAQGESSVRLPLSSFAGGCCLVRFETADYVFPQKVFFTNKQ